MNEIPRDGAPTVSSRHHGLIASSWSPWESASWPLHHGRGPTRCRDHRPDRAGGQAADPRTGNDGDGHRRPRRRADLRLRFFPPRISGSFRHDLRVQRAALAQTPLSSRVTATTRTHEDPGQADDVEGKTATRSAPLWRSGTGRAFPRRRRTPHPRPGPQALRGNAPRVDPMIALQTDSAREGRCSSVRACNSGCQATSCVGDLHHLESLPSCQARTISKTSVVGLVHRVVILALTGVSCTGSLVAGEGAIL